MTLFQLGGFELTKTETSLNATKEKDREIRSLGYSSPQMLNDINHVYSKECEMYRSVKKAIVDSYKLHYLFCFVFLGWEGIFKKNIQHNLFKMFSFSFGIVLWEISTRKKPFEGVFLWRQYSVSQLSLSNPYISVVV